MPVICRKVLIQSDYEAIGDKRKKEAIKDAKKISGE
jgi:hypothetical protein